MGSMGSEITTGENRIKRIPAQVACAQNRCGQGLPRFVLFRQPTTLPTERQATQFSVVAYKNENRVGHRCLSGRSGVLGLMYLLRYDLERL